MARQVFALAVVFIVFIAVVGMVTADKSSPAAAPKSSITIHSPPQKVTSAPNASPAKNSHTASPASNAHEASSPAPPSPAVNIPGGDEDTPAPTPAFSISPVVDSAATPVKIYALGVAAFITIGFFF